MHQILDHNCGFYYVYFTTQFLEGLRHDIHAGVVLHQPKDLDSAFSLASMQEELLEALPRREYRRQESPPARAPPCPFLPVVVPLGRPIQGPPVAAEDWRGQEAARPQDRGAATTGSLLFVITDEHVNYASNVGKGGGPVSNVPPLYKSTLSKSSWSYSKQNTQYSSSQTMMIKKRC